MTMIGKKFGRLTAIATARFAPKPSYRCRCECGRETVVMRYQLRSGSVASCGCLRRETSARQGRANTVHGMRYSPEYRSWTSMKKRCLNKNCEDWPRYGGRGITVCHRWMTFQNFLADMGPRPTGMTIDRIDVDGNYEPGNCRWAANLVQGANRRNTKWITHDGVTDSTRGWARRIGISQPGLVYRLGTMPVDQALAYGRSGE